ncbi:ABC transporter permease subunit [Cohnella sp. NL03-T5]|nr:ABC transporter permease subunit [Cohnella silvisoli]
MMVPAMIYFLLFRYGPMYGIVLAFKDFKITQGIWNSPWAGFKYFDMAFSDPYFYVVVKNTVIISLYKLLFGFPVPILFAILLNEVRRAVFKKWVQTVSYLPYFISWIVLGGMFLSIFSLDGLINQIVQLFGHEPILFLADDAYFRTILVSTHIFQTFGWESVIYFAAIAGIDPQLYEAAVMDGANRFQRAIRITLPSLLPVISILFILRMTSVLDAGFDQIFNLYSVSVYNVADVIDTFVYRKGLVESEYSYSTAVNLFKSVIALVLVVGVNRIAKSAGGKENTLW